MDVHTQHLLLALADGRLPVGGHTQSAGLEPAQLAGLPAGDVPALVATRLRTVVRVEAGTAVVARHVLLAGLPLVPVQQAWAARTPGAAARRASVELGRGLLRLLRRQWPGSGATAAVEALEAPARAVVLGALAVAAGLTAEATALLAAYDDVQTLATAAPKLYPLDPAAASGWVLDAGAEVAALVGAVAGLTAPEDIPSSAAPALEAWVEAHPDRPRRLFRA
jgi:urease accessory protein